MILDNPKSSNVIHTQFIKNKGNNNYKTEIEFNGYPNLAQDFQQHIQLVRDRLKAIVEGI